MFDFEYHLKVLPDKPGVYLMKNYLGNIIYVGKAKNLKNRVRQYFQNSSSHTEKVQVMVKNIAEFEYIITDSEVEALILECNLIKKYNPKYNILLKDDKHYPFIKITIHEDFPRVIMTRNKVKDNNKYFGPYTDYKAVYETLDLIKKIFPLRKCKGNIVEGMKPKRACLNYHIGFCKGPCEQHISKDEYMKIVQDVIDLLNGKDTNILRSLKEEMKSYSENLEFEKAASIRDKILSIEKIREKQSIYSKRFEDEDFINIYKDENDACIQIFFVRDGKVNGREEFIIENTMDSDDGKIIEEFIERFYSGTPFIPKTIYVPYLDELELIEKWLTLKKESKVTVKIPQKGEKLKLLEIVHKNAKMYLEQFKIKNIRDRELQEIALKELQTALSLEEIPMRIEAYDISNIQGVDSVGSMIVFENGKPKYSDYRRFKIKNVEGPNDYDSMREILTRRFNRGLKEVQSIKDNKIEFSAGKFSYFPDLILMDGGKGQVNIALEVLNELNINIPVSGMVKDDYHNSRTLVYNNIELDLKEYKNVMNLVARIQDEAHRFAITYHRTLRDKRIFNSVLDDIPNIGQKRRKDLLEHFGSVENIMNATYDKLIQIKSIDKKTAESILKYFKNNK